MVMLTNTNNERLLLQNLKDAGCNSKMIKRFLELEQLGKKQEQLHLLFMYRADLLEKLHISQNKLDCLDYLVYKIKKNK